MRNKIRRPNPTATKTNSQLTKPKGDCTMYTEWMDYLKLSSKVTGITFSDETKPRNIIGVNSERKGAQQRQLESKWTKDEHIRYITELEQKLKHPINLLDLVSVFDRLDVAILSDLGVLR